MSLTVEIVAADREVWSGEAKQLSCRTIEGELGILAGHAPVLAVLASGELHLDPVEGDRRTITVDGGFLSVDHDKVTVVAEKIDAPALES